MREIIRSFNGKIIEHKHISNQEIKNIEDMNYEELKIYGRKLQAECGGCNRREKDEDQ